MNNSFKNVDSILRSMLYIKESTFSKYANSYNKNQDNIVKSFCLNHQNDTILVKISENNNEYIKNFLEKIGFTFDSIEYNGVFMKFDPKNISIEQENLINSIIDNTKLNDFLEELHLKQGNKINDHFSEKNMNQEFSENKVSLEDLSNYSSLQKLIEEILKLFGIKEESNVSKKSPEEISEEKISKEEIKEILQEESEEIIEEVAKIFNESRFEYNDSKKISKLELSK